jgi:hypothetical protein
MARTTINNGASVADARAELTGLITGLPQDELLTEDTRSLSDLGPPYCGGGLLAHFSAHSR